MIIEIARSMHVAACRPFIDEYRDARLAAPFGTPEGMPLHEWRVSQDILQWLYNASPLLIGPNPKNGDDGTTRLFGWPVILDKTLPPGTLRLEASLSA